MRTTILRERPSTITKLKRRKSVSPTLNPLSLVRLPHCPRHRQKLTCQRDLIWGMTEKWHPKWSFLNILYSKTCCNLGYSLAKIETASIRPNYICGVLNIQIPSWIQAFLDLNCIQICVYCVCAKTVTSKPSGQKGILSWCNIVASIPNLNSDLISGQREPCY